MGTDSLLKYVNYLNLLLNEIINQFPLRLDTSECSTTESFSESGTKASWVQFTTRLWVSSQVHRTFTLFVSQEVYAQTTTKKRTQLSLQLFAAGMFFLDRAKIAFNPNFNWRQLNFTSRPFDNDPILFPLGKFCSRFIQDFSKNYALVLEENKQLFGNLSVLTGKSFENAFDIILLTSVLDAQVGADLLMRRS